MRFSRQLVFAVLILIVMSGCNDDNIDNINLNEAADHIWTEQSQLIVITQTGGIAGVRKTYTFSRDSLSDEAKLLLGQLVIDNSAARCDPDSFRYQIVITDSMGLSREYNSGIGGCAGEEVNEYIETVKFENAFSLMRNFM